MTKAEIAPVTIERAAPRVRLPGANLLRAVGVLAVIYSHISYYFIDDLGSGWWLIDIVYRVFVQGARLNQHLSFLGVAFFMVLTGALITGSAIRHRPGIFLFNRIGRLIPLLWVTIAVAIVLVRLHVNGMFSGGPGINAGQAAASFVLGGFFFKPEFAVLGVTWTLVVQIAFYLYCVGTRSMLRTKPGLVPLLGAALCIAIVLYDHYVSASAVLPILGKIAATLPAVFVGQVFYLAWARLVAWWWIAAGLLAQIGVVWLASDVKAYWGGDRYLWTIIFVALCVLLLAGRDGLIARSAVVNWIGTRSYPIYLVHTLILYRLFSSTVGWLGKTGAIALFVAVTVLVSEAAYRWIEVPAGRWISLRVKRQSERKTPTTK